MYGEGPFRDERQTLLRRIAITTSIPAPKKTKPKVTADEVLTLLLVEAARRDSVDVQALIRKTCVNVFDDKWRINLWVTINNPVVPNAGRIVKSYFVKFENGELNILED